MKYVALTGGKELAVEISRMENTYRLTIENRSFTVDAFHPGPQSISMLIEGKSYEVGLEKKGNKFTVYLFDDTIELDLIEARKYRAAVETKRGGSSGPVKIQAPMPGKIIKVAVTENSEVHEGDPLLIMEAMKMQNELKSPKAGIVTRIQVKEGEPVGMSQVLMIVE